MKIIDVVKAFNRGEKYGKASNGRVRIENNYLINFDTIIATRTSQGILLNNRYYSRTTSKLQNMIRANCNVIREFQGEKANFNPYISWC